MKTVVARTTSLLAPLELLWLDIAVVHLLGPMEDMIRVHRSGTQAMDRVHLLRRVAAVGGQGEDGVNLCEEQGI